MIVNETKLHGTIDFQMELYHLDTQHPRYDMNFHWHTNIELIRILSGKLFVKLDDREYEGSRGDIFIVNSETVHGATPQDCVYECIVFNPEIVPYIYENGESVVANLASGVFRFDEKPSKNTSLYKYVNEIFDTLKMDNAAPKYMALALLCKLFASVIEEKAYSTYLPADKKSASVKKLKKILKYIRDSYGKNITLDDMAKETNMSPKYFCTFFKEMTNKTPFDYLISYRTEKAAHLLTNTDTPVTDIAFDCGFNDLSYFIKTFKKYFGCSPGVYRKSHR